MLLRRAALFAAPWVPLLAPLATAAPSAREILDATGVRGGLIVHVGCGDGQLTAALRANDSYVVHGLDADPDNVERSRQHIASRKGYGPVSVDRLSGDTLPYVDNLVNLIVSESIEPVPMDECLRVLAPGGIAYIRSDGEWKKTVKPRPDTIDEWTHDLHGPGGNPVSKDRIAGPPRHLQWTAGPLWARSHGWTPSVSAMVSSNGRLFALCDETLTCVDGSVPSRWFLVARDAFSGVLLWKHPVPSWDSMDFSGTRGNGAVPRFTMPPQLGKRLVAVGDTVYITLGSSAPVTAIDAVTGRILRAYEGTDRADEILLSEGRLIASLNPEEKPGGETPQPASGKRVCASNAKTGKPLWNVGPLTAVRSTKSQDPYGRLELAAGDGCVFALTGGAVVCLDAETGETRWRVDRPTFPTGAVTKIGYGGVYEFLLSVMLYHDGVVLLAQPEPNTHHTYHTMPGTLFAFDAGDGRLLWKHAYGGWGHCTQPDVFVVGDTVWTHVNAETEFGSVWGSGYKAKDSSKVDYRIQGLDLRTGRPRKEFRTKDIFNVGHHHRCYRNRSTERYLLSSRHGVEFVDLATGENFQNHWVRSGCLLGNVPCNGLVYVAPHPCGCYIEAKLTAFNALAPARIDTPDTPDDRRLRRGPAFGFNGMECAPRPGDWPTYRHDSRRSGATETAVGAKLDVAWRSEIGTRLSAPVVSGGRVLLADVDAHAVYSLQAVDGKVAWRHIAGGRVDSPPTCHEGRVLFGCRDGRVSCLRAVDGAMVWRFDAAPADIRMTAFDQLESHWPVPGSVLVHEERCWFAAGRSSYLDGGIRVYTLDPSTGKQIRLETVYHPDPKTGKMTPNPSPNKIPGLLSDIPVTDGTHVFIRQMNVSGSDTRPSPHLYTSGGFLDASWFNRTHWRYGKAMTSGLLVLGRDAACGVELFQSRSRETVFKPGSGAYRIRCLPLKASPSAGPKAKRKRNATPPTRWETGVPIRVTALVRAGGLLYAAGSPDTVDAKDPHASWEGRAGGLLVILDIAEGRKRAELQLPAPPVWDGMAAVENHLLLSLTDGSVICLKGK